ncbi:paired small multidrug resistance pump [Parelusimicrobium proximum]|uniref:DMT family transporter n=1 Tax=Parelusimicrobium proximum TaxID=3228953 RepID=UPI003D16EC83
MKNKSLLFLALTCIFELLWVYGFNVAAVWWHWALTVIIIVLDFYFLAKACEGMPTGTVYAVFSAVGTAGITLMDIFLFGGELSLLKIGFIAILVGGVISLKLADNRDVKKEV